MGAGKSTVGVELAARLGWQFCDLDNVIEAENHWTIGEIFKHAGEAAFRRMESAALHQVLNSTVPRPPALVLALGGGAFAQAANREALNLNGAKVVWLDAPASELWRRCAADNKARPLQQDQASFKHLLAERLPSYQQADLTVLTAGKSVADIAAEIESRLALASG